MVTRALRPPPPAASGHRSGTQAELAVIDARGEAPWRVVAGIPLVTRLVRSLEAEGLDRIAVVVDRGVDARAPGALRPGTRAEVLPAPDGAGLAGALGDLPGDTEILVVDGSLVVDPRLLRHLREAPSPTRLVQDAGGDAGGARIVRVRASQLHRLGAGPDAVAGWHELELTSLPTYAPKMRGQQPILLLDASTPEAASRAAHTLVERTQKFVMDWPARWIDPPVENALVRWLAPTRLSPDHVTWIGAGVGFLAAWLLWHGWLVPALPLMLLVGWLDGVDGKLARVRLRGGRIGDHEAIFDFFIENAWYVALGVWFHAAGHGDAALWAAAVLIAANLLDEVSYTLANSWIGHSLDLLSPADAAFRLVAGRRNVYVWYLVVAVLAGLAWEGFLLCTAWALVTGVAHAVRLVVASRRGGPRGDVARPGGPSC